MSIGSTNPIVASTAGTPIALSSGNEAARAARARVEAQRQTALDRAAEDAAGISQTDGESLRPGDRDGDGRQPWRFPSRPQHEQSAAHQLSPTPPPDSGDNPPSQIDLRG